MNIVNFRGGCKYTPWLRTCQVSLRTAIQTVLDCHKLLLRLQPDDQMQVLSRLFLDYTCRQCPNSLRVSTEFFSIMLRGMRHLNKHGRINVIRALVQAIGIMRPGSSDSLLPAKRMPMGLIEYCVNFFNASSVNKYVHI